MKFSISKVIICKFVHFGWLGFVFCSPGSNWKGEGKKGRQEMPRLKLKLTNKHLSQVRIVEESENAPFIISRGSRTVKGSSKTLQIKRESDPRSWDGGWKRGDILSSSALGGTPWRRSLSPSSRREIPSISLILSSLTPWRRSYASVQHSLPLRLKKLTPTTSILQYKMALPIQQI